MMSIVASSTWAVMHVIAGIGWEPEIRGALVILTGSTVLFGSIWLILATNIGNRVGTLNALAGFFGWMAIMGLVWWIYGIGLQGDSPSWTPVETVYGEISDSTVSDDVRALGNVETVSAPSLVERFCPGLVDATVTAQRARVAQDNLDIAVDYSSDKAYCVEELGEKLAVDTETITEQLTAANDQLKVDSEATGLADTRILDDTALDAQIETTIRDRTVQLNQLTLSGLAALSPDIIDDATNAGLLDFGDWTLQSTGEAGEAIAAADAFLVADIDQFAASGDFFVIDAYQIGGKPKKVEGESLWDRTYTEVRNTVVFWHPKNTTVITVASTIDKNTIEGQAPPFSEIDPNSQIVSVVMERDLGSVRLPAAIITLGSLVAFLGLCAMLHSRDLELRRRVDEWDPAAAT